MRRENNADDDSHLASSANISTDELAYLQQAAKAAQDGEKAFAAARAALESYGAYLIDRYKLGPTDTLQAESGVITRTQGEPEPEPLNGVETRPEEYAPVY